MARGRWAAPRVREQAADGTDPRLGTAGAGAAAITAVAP